MITIKNFHAIASFLSTKKPHIVLEELGLVNELCNIVFTQQNTISSFKNSHQNFHNAHKYLLDSQRHGQYFINTGMLLNDQLHIDGMSYPL